MRPQVVVVGAGFGGLEAAKQLADAPVDVTVVDRRNHHLFQPLLYQVATAGLNPADIAQPIRQILRDQQNCRIVLAEATGIDTDERQLLTDQGPIAYDHLVVAVGATHAYFGNDEWAAHAPGLKTIDDALDMRRRILTAFEHAEATDDPDDRRRNLTFVVVGGGPTGVELAGAIEEIATQTLRPDFRRIDTTDAHVILLEAGPRVLSAFPEELSASAERQLRELGVDVRTDTAVTDVDDEGVDTADGRIPAATVLWGAGVAASPLVAALGTETDKAGRLLVDETLRPTGLDDVWVIGDCAAVTDVDGVTVPGVAPAAQQEGETVARSIIALLGGGEPERFRYVDKGSMATIGRSRAVAHVGRLKISGYVAWVAWWLVHIWSLVGFRSRAAVMAGWGWQYVTKRRQARLITSAGSGD